MNLQLQTPHATDWFFELPLSRRTLGGKAMAVDQFGNVLIGGIGGYPPAINAEGCLMLLDSNGVERWYRESPTAIGQSSSLGEWSGVKALSNGNVLCMGRWSDQFLGSGVNGMCMAAYDTAGTLLWYYQGLDGGFWTNWETAFFDGYQDTDSTFIACGQVAQPTWRRALVYRFTVDGDSLWRREYAHYASTSSDPVERPWDIEPTSDGGMVLTGETWDCAASQCHDLWLLKLDSMGCLVPGCQYVGISDIAFGLEDALHVWPNPSDGRFNVELGLPAELEIRGQLLLQVFDATGRLVLRKDLGRQLEQAIALDLSGEPPGIYHVHITDERRMLTGVSLVLE